MPSSASSGPSKTSTESENTGPRPAWVVDAAAPRPAASDGEPRADGRRTAGSYQTRNRSRLTRPRALPSMALPAEGNPMAAHAAEAGRIAVLAARPAVRDALAWAGAAEAEIAEETVRVTEIPAPTFREERRAVYVAERLESLGLAGVEIAPDRNVYALLPGDAEERPALALFAHLDTVFGEGVPVAVSRRDGRLYAPGVGDNSAGVAGLLCALRAMRE